MDYVSSYLCNSALIVLCMWAQSLFFIFFVQLGERGVKLNYESAYLSSLLLGVCIYWILIPYYYYYYTSFFFSNQARVPVQQCKQPKTKRIKTYLCDLRCVICLFDDWLMVTWTKICEFSPLITNWVCPSDCRIWPHSSSCFLQARKTLLYTNVIHRII